MCAQALSQSSDALSCNEVSHHLMTWPVKTWGIGHWQPAYMGTGRPGHGERGRPAHGGRRVGRRADRFNPRRLAAVTVQRERTSLYCNASIHQSVCSATARVGAWPGPA